MGIRNIFGRLFNSNIETNNKVYENEVFENAFEESSSMQTNETLIDELFKEKTFYKFSKANADFTHLYVENFYTNYEEGKLIIDKLDGNGFSFVEAKNAIMAIPYGDQLTEIIWDKENALSFELLNANVKYTGSGLGEYVSNIVVVGKNLPLENPETIKKLVEMSSYKAFFTAINAHNESMNISRHLKNLNFNLSHEFWNEILKSYNEKRHVYTKDHINEIYNEFKLKHEKEFSKLEFTNNNIKKEEKSIENEICL